MINIISKLTIMDINKKLNEYLKSNSEETKNYVFSILLAGENNLPEIEYKNSNVDLI